MFIHWPAPGSTLAEYRTVLASWAVQAEDVIRKAATTAGKKALCDTLKAAEIVDLVVGALGIESGVLVTAITALVFSLVADIKRKVGC